jgi:cobyrinic acid a,c-diamide synthase
VVETSQRIPRIVIAGTHSGVGKTTVASGLMAALRARGHSVAPFKVGPDFIDPSYHALATDRPGRNLDAFLSGEDLIGPLFAHGASGADVAVIEGVMGLFDGKSGGGEFASTAHIAKLLDAPVLLVVDAGAMARSAAAIVHGYATFDPKLRVAGAILNRVGSPTHEAMLREAIEPLGIPVLGVLHRVAKISTPDRHLGLVPVAERRGEAKRALEAAGEKILASCNLEGIMRLAASAEPLYAEPWDPEASENGTPRTGPVRISVASGPAFSFVYEENLELLRGAGAEIYDFDPTSDEALPEGTNALYLGGGFPETYAEALSANEPLRKEVRAFAESGRPVIAECGGLLYLCRELDGRQMCGVLDAKARMTNQLSLGYRKAQALADSPLAAVDTTLRGHEFHYSAVEPQAGRLPDASPAWELSGRGEEGFVADRVHASYLHTHWAATPEVARRLVRNSTRGAEIVAERAPEPTAKAPI